MANTGRLMEMLADYAAAHRHPFNIAVHLIGIPTIMLGVLIPLTWAGIDVGAVTINLGHVLILGFFVFYLTLDTWIAVAFLLLALLLAEYAAFIGAMPVKVSGMIAAGAFAGGYLAQFVGHAVEKSLPVLVRHPVRANLAAPFFTVLELFRLLGLRGQLFDDIRRRG